MMNITEKPRPVFKGNDFKAAEPALQQVERTHLFLEKADLRFFIKNGIRDRRLLVLQHLHQIPVFITEAGVQVRMVVQHGFDRADKPFGIHVLTFIQIRNIIGRALPVFLPGKIDSALVLRNRTAFPGSRGCRLRQMKYRRFFLILQDLCDPADRRRLHQFPDRDGSAQACLDLRGKMHQHDGAHSQTDQIIRHAEFTDIQILFRNRDQLLLQLCPGPCDLLISARSRRKRSSVDLSAGRKRHLGKMHKYSRNHIGCQRLFHKCFQRRLIDSAAVFRAVVQDQPVILHRCRRKANALIMSGAGLDFSQLYSVAAQLDLIVGSSQAFHLAFFVISSQIPGMIHPKAFDKGAFFKALRRFFRELPVAHARLGTGIADFSRHAPRQKIAVSVDNENVSVCHGASDGNPAVIPVRIQIIERYDIRTLRGPVSIRNCIGMTRLNIRQRFPAQRNKPHMQVIVADQHLSDGGGKASSRDPVSFQERINIIRFSPDGFGHDK